MTPTLWICRQEPTTFLIRKHSDVLAYSVGGSVHEIPLHLGIEYSCPDRHPMTVRQLEPVSPFIWSSRQLGFPHVWVCAE